MIPSNIDELYTIRMFIYLESSPQSNKYHQIILTREKYKKLSQFMFENIMDKCDDCDKKAWEVEDEFISLPDKDDAV